ncbi:MAG: hypothetical protein P4L46_10310 [Fimbriimonas sp.]|nr:hypothetical protein [Fimbriimonas sp.]
MKLSTRHSICLALVGFSIALPIVGCNATNDNPINPDKMNQIRQQETRDRANYKPSTTAPSK